MMQNICRKITFLLAASTAILLSWTTVSEDSLALPIRLSDFSRDGIPSIKEIEAGVYEWSLPDGRDQTLRIDLAAAGIDLASFDEFRFDIMPVGAAVDIPFMLVGVPDAESVSNRYIKTRTPLDTWSPVRFELATDDDGMYLKRDKNEKPGTLLIRLAKLTMGVPGEPVSRTARIRNPRFVKRLFSVEADRAAATTVADGARFVNRHPIRVRNLTDRVLTVTVDPDAARSLRYFSAEAPKSLALAPKGEANLVVSLSIPRDTAMALPGLYAEPALPKIAVDGIPDSDVILLESYRPRPLWGIAPLQNRVVWTPAAYSANLDAWAKIIPEVAARRKWLTDAADKRLGVPCPIPQGIVPGYGLNCICDACGAETAPLVETEFTKHRCTKCDKRFDNVETITRAYIAEYYGKRARDCRQLATAWLATGDRKYADKAVEIMLAFAEAHPKMPCNGMRSTAGRTKLGLASLFSSYVLPNFAEAFYFLSAWFDDDPNGEKAPARKKIADFLVAEALLVSQHCSGYTNQTVEHFRAYGSAGLAAGFLPLVAEAIHSDFGFHYMVEYGFSEDGITHEAGAYHHAIFGSLNAFAWFLSIQDFNLYTARFKRIFDGSIAADLARTSYESAYRHYRDPAYIEVVARQRAQLEWFPETMLLDGVMGLPEAGRGAARSVLMPQAGYVFLRKGEGAERMELRANYLKVFDRHESDRLSVFLYRGGEQIDSSASRINYSSPHCGWIFETAAHNAIVIDGKKQDNVEGILLAFDPSPETPAAVIASTPGNPMFPGVEQIRALALIRNAYLVVDIVRAPDGSVVDRYQHGIGGLTTAPATAPCAATPACVPASGHFSALQEAPPAEDIELKYSNGLVCRIVGNGKLRLYTASTFAGWRGDPQPVAWLRHDKTSPAAYVAAYRFGEQDPFTKLELVGCDAQSLKFKISWPDATYTVELDVSAKRIKISK